MCIRDRAFCVPASFRQGKAWCDPDGIGQGVRPGSFIARIPHGILRYFISKPPFHLYDLHFHPIAADFGEKTKESTAALDKEWFCTMIVVHTTMQIHLFEIRPGGLSLIHIFR